MPEVDIRESSPAETISAFREALADPALTEKERKTIRRGVSGVAKGTLDAFDFEKGAMAVHLKRTAEGPDAPVALRVDTPGVHINRTGRSAIEDDVRREARARGFWGGTKKTVAESVRNMNTLFDDMKIAESLRQPILANILADIEAEHRDLKRRQADTLSKLGHLDRQREVFNEIEEWTREPFQLQRPDGSAFHKLQETMRAGDVLVPAISEDYPKGWGRSLDPVSHSFVIGHDWAAAFANAKDFDGGEWRLPYEHTAFEFVFSGKRVIFVVSEDAAYPRQGLLFANLRGGWSMLTTFDLPTGASPRPRIDTENKILEALATACMAQIRAVAIALESEVAVSEIVRAPHKLNAAREKRGKLPILDYHVVALSKRTRYMALPDPSSPVEAEPRRHPRLHFVRGHWRHFPNHKTWIRWFLRGDSDLGFIDKHYRL